MDRLRALSASQQVALLFVALFGVLVTVSIAAFARSLRERDAPSEAAHARTVRALGVVWAWGALFWAAWASGPFVSTLLFGVLSFVVLREFVTLTHTRRGDHRSLILAFFVALPVQYVLVAERLYEAFTVFIPVYVFFAIPVAGAFGNDPQRFLERTAKIQWGIMVCVYGLSHAPALLLLDLPRAAGRGAFLVLYLVLVVGAAQIGQEAAARRIRARPVARAISRTFSWRAWGAGLAAGGGMGALLAWSTPFSPLAALGMGVLAGGAGTLGGFVIQALERDAGLKRWGTQPSVTGAFGLLDRTAPLCFAAPVFFHSVRGSFGA
jgi:phosphatidate cytidylyltransferase